MQRLITLTQQNKVLAVTTICLQRATEAGLWVVRLTIEPVGLKGSRVSERFDREQVDTSYLRLEEVKSCDCRSRSVGFHTARIYLQLLRESKPNR